MQLNIAIPDDDQIKKRNNAITFNKWKSHIIHSSQNTIKRMIWNQIIIYLYKEMIDSNVG